MKRELTCGQIIDDTIFTRGLETYYHFEAEAGDRIELRVLRTGGETFFRPWFGIYQPDACTDTVVSGVNTTSGPIVLPETGTYSIRVADDDSFQTGTYTLSLDRLDPICDCNSNGVRDDADIASGTSRDENGNDVPDECDDVASLWIEEVDRETRRIMSWNDVPARGGELGLVYDASVITNVEVSLAPELAGAVELFSVEDLASCDATGDTGVTVAWSLVDQGGAPLDRGSRHLLTVSYEGVEGIDPGSCSPIAFVDCLGPAAAPVENRLIDQHGTSHPSLTFDGEACVPLVPVDFRRGDPNGDARFDMGDPITILICLFLGASCTECPDAFDANDDGIVDVSDSSYLVNWRFGNGPQPAGPFPLCGADATADDLGCLGVTCN